MTVTKRRMPTDYVVKSSDYGGTIDRKIFESVYRVGQKPAINIDRLEKKVLKNLDCVSRMHEFADSRKRKPQNSLLWKVPMELKNPIKVPQHR